MTTTVISSNNKPVNVRSGASTSNSILGTLDPGETVEVLENQGTWCHISHAKFASGYMMTKFLQLESQITTAQLQAIYNSLKATLALIEPLLK